MWIFSEILGNYANASGTVHDQIAKADAVCAATGYDVTYDALPHTATGSCQGVKGETLAGLNLAGTTHTAAGTYSDTASFTDLTGNYNNGTTPVVDHIGLRAMSLSLSSDSKVYGTTYSGTIVLTQSGLRSGDSVDCDRTSAGFAPTAVLGTYPITCSNIHGTGVGNYDITVTPGSLEVTKATLYITADNQTKSYGDPSFDLGSTAFHTSGLAPFDSVTSVVLYSTGEPVTAPMGAYGIGAFGAVGTGLSNYIIWYQDGPLNVGRAHLTITASSPDMTYGGTVPTINPIITGYVNGENESPSSTVRSSASQSPPPPARSGLPRARVARASTATITTSPSCPAA